MWSALADKSPSGVGQAIDDSAVHHLGTNLDFDAAEHLGVDGHIELDVAPVGLGKDRVV